MTVQLQVVIKMTAIVISPTWLKFMMLPRSGSRSRVRCQWCSTHTELCWWFPVCSMCWPLRILFKKLKMELHICTNMWRTLAEIFPLFHSPPLLPSDAQVRSCLLGCEHWSSEWPQWHLSMNCKYPPSSCFLCRNQKHCREKQMVQESTLFWLILIKNVIHLHKNTDFGLLELKVHHSWHQV